MPNACDGWSCTYLVQGPIRQSVVDELRAFIAARPTGLPLAVHFESPGGDLAAAIALGRLLRSNAPVSGTVYSGASCIGACVVALVGTTTRYVDGALIGIHRPYAAAAEPRPKDVKKAAAPQPAPVNLDAELRAYLGEMNVPPQLVDEMLRYETSSVHALTIEELARFRIAGIDWAWQDHEDSAAAERYGIDRPTYRQRQAQAGRQCDRLLREAGATSESEAWTRCRQAVLAGTPAPAASAGSR